MHLYFITIQEIQEIEHAHAHAHTHTHTNVGTVPKSNRKIVETCKSLSLAHKYMTAHFPGLRQVGGFPISSATI